MKIKCDAGNNNPFKYTDPSGHGALDWFKKIFGAFIAALVGVVTAFIVASAPGFVAALGAVGSKVVAGTVGGIIGGALGGAITGGHMGALMGLAFGAVGGALGGLGSAGLSEIGVKTFWGQFAVMSGVGAALSGGLGGWEGLVTFGAGALGALAGMGITGGFGTSTKQLSSGHEKIKPIGFEYKSQLSNTAAQQPRTEGAMFSGGQSGSIGGDMGTGKKFEIGPISVTPQQSSSVSHHNIINNSNFLTRIFTDNSYLPYFMTFGAAVGGIQGGTVGLSFNMLPGPMRLVAGMEAATVGTIIGSSTGAMIWMTGNSIVTDGWRGASIWFEFLFPK